jgi:hypothetical protein
LFLILEGEVLYSGTIAANMLYYFVCIKFLWFRGMLYLTSVAHGDAGPFWKATMMEGNGISIGLAASRRKEKSTALSSMIKKS